MDFDEYRRTYFVEPAPEQRFEFRSSFGTAVYYEDYAEAILFYEKVLGPPAYMEGDGTRGWPIGNGWLTILKGGQGNPQNVEITLEVESAAQAEALQADFIQAGAMGGEPSDQLMYRPIRSCPVVDPFGLQIMVVAPLDNKRQAS
jgi:hypothetical protein